MTSPDEPRWKLYQADFKKKKTRKTRIRSGIRFAVILSLVIFALYGMFDRFLQDTPHRKVSSENPLNRPEDADTPLQDKSFIQRLFKDLSLINLPKKRFQLTLDGRTFIIDTSIDIDLQNHLLTKMDRKNSRYIGVVALEPKTGKLVMMAGFDKQDPAHNTCLDNRFPAASIFKIVTAAAAVEQCGLNSNSTLTFNGNQHTLYKRQLKDRTNKYTNHISLRDSFAKSVNPVFGKIGKLQLGKEALRKYAEAFGFNSTIGFEKPLSPSRFTIEDDPYNWAEIASGFNRKTTLSPLHGALMASIIVNEGKAIEPSIIEKIITDGGDTIIPAQSAAAEEVISPPTARVVYDLMEATIRYGTGSKAFRGYRRDPVLSKLNIGGKTGSIYNKSHELRYDWFVGFADVKNGNRQLAVAVVVAHEKYIGIRASQYARMAMKKYFTDAFHNDIAQAQAKHAG